jgi:hypothetical protein
MGNGNGLPKALFILAAIVLMGLALDSFVKAELLRINPIVTPTDCECHCPTDRIEKYWNEWEQNDNG